MRMPSRRVMATLIGASVVMLTTTGVVIAGTPDLNDWPYGPQDHASATLVAVGDIACEPNDAENSTTPSSLKCGSPALGGYAAEFATAAQAQGMHPDAVALLGDEQYEVGKLTDFEQSFDQAWGGLKALERPAPGNHEYYAYTKKGDNEAAQNGLGYFSYFNGHQQDGAPYAQGQAGDDNATTQGWYSYDLNGWHVISLNAECASATFNNDCSTTDGGLLAQETAWLAQDLKQSHDQCTIAYWHQPTFSATTPASAGVDPAGVGAGGPEGLATDAWWKLLYADHATLILNGHEHAYARFRPMDPQGQSDPKNGITQLTIGSGGEALDTLATDAAGAYSNPNVVTAQAAAYGVGKLTLTHNHWSIDYAPSYAPPGAPSDALSYHDTASGSCRGDADS